MPLWSLSLSFQDFCEVRSTGSSKAYFERSDPHFGKLANPKSPRFGTVCEKFEKKGEHVFQNDEIFFISRKCKWCASFAKSRMERLSPFLSADSQRL